MNREYEISDIELDELDNSPDPWTLNDYRKVLHEIDYDDPESIADNELYDMLLMALDEAGFEESGKAVFKVIVKDGMTDGQIVNTIHKLEDERIWESYAEFGLHYKLYKASWLMYQAFPSSCLQPEYLKLTCKISADHESLALLESHFDRSAFLRLAASGMGDSFIITRLFEKQVQKGQFPEAEEIIWEFKPVKSDGCINLEAISSHFWFNDFEDAESISCSINEKDFKL